MEPRADESPSRPGDVEDYHPDVPRLQIVRRWMIRIGLLTVATACVGALALAHLAREAPTWWRHVNPSDERTIRHADLVENRFVTVLYDERETDETFDVPDEWRSKPWGVERRATDANAWLNARLPRWLRNQEQDFLWPRELQQLQVDFDGDRIRIGVLLD
ncbi:MAG: hypothetical protein KDA28_07120, partial [Phycisphaerales bacterium]|nr:hypothetical protein [Phycisphaerales bacterium]